MILYGLTILRVGYFLSTSIFLVLSYIVLGERKWIMDIFFIFSFCSNIYVSPTRTIKYLSS